MQPFVHFPELYQTLSPETLVIHVNFFPLSKCQKTTYVKNVNSTNIIEDKHARIEKRAFIWSDFLQLLYTPKPGSDQTIKAFHSTLNGLRGCFFLIISELLEAL